MITNHNENKIISSMGWVDKGNLWFYDVDLGKEKLLDISNADYVGVHAGKNDYFSTVHHYKESLEIVLRNFNSPKENISIISIKNHKIDWSGSKEEWNNVPLHYVDFIKNSKESDYRLIKIDVESENIQLIPLSWFDDSYDKGYQGIVSVIEIPDSDNVLITVQRSSKVIHFNVQDYSVINIIKLAGRSGNPSGRFLQSKNELWIDDYDTLLCLDGKSFEIKYSKKLQEATQEFIDENMRRMPDLDPDTMGQFIGDFNFSKQENLCVVARPFSGDVVGIDPNTFKINSIAKLGSQPLEACVIENDLVFSRDWKSGELLSGKLEKKWL